MIRCAVDVMRGVPSVRQTGCCLPTCSAESVRARFAPGGQRQVNRSTTRRSSDNHGDPPAVHALTLPRSVKGTFGRRTNTIEQW